MNLRNGGNCLTSAMKDAWLRDTFKKGLGADNDNFQVKNIGAVSLRDPNDCRPMLDRFADLCNTNQGIPYGLHTFMNLEGSARYDRLVELSPDHVFILQCEDKDMGVERQLAFTVDPITRGVRFCDRQLNMEVKTLGAKKPEDGFSLAKAGYSSYSPRDKYEPAPAVGTLTAILR